MAVQSAAWDGFDDDVGRDDDVTDPCSELLVTHVLRVWSARLQSLQHSVDAPLDKQFSGVWWGGVWLCVVRRRRGKTSRVSSLAAAALCILGAACWGHSCRGVNAYVSLCVCLLSVAAVGIMAARSVVF